jgi:hypothetical protein
MADTVQPTGDIAPILQRLDTEVLLSVLDVTLDIDGKLAVTDDQMFYIEGTRTRVRFAELYPVQSVGAMYRYVELRGMGLRFLEKHGYIENFEFCKQGISGFDGRFRIVVHDPRPIAEALIALRGEQGRRWPQQKAGTDIRSAAARLTQLADSLHAVAIRLRDRRSGRQPLIIEDEYDVQYLFAALLETQFSDVRPEEPGPSRAGAPSRLDFLLKNEAVMVEMKMTRTGLTDKKLGEELIVDIERYKARSDCKALVCFVYDPDHRLTNPRGLENDLTKTTDDLDVRVLIRPKS